MLPEIYTKVAGWNYTNYVIVPISAIRHGLTLETTDSNYKVVAFKSIYIPLKGEKLEQKMPGNQLNTENFEVLNSAKPGDIIRFEFVKARNENMSLEIHALQLYIKEDDE